MVVEHVFITTMEAPEALGLASSFLQQVGFAVQEQMAFQVGNDWNVLDVRRGKTSRWKPAECSQQMRLEYDRGRITMATIISPRNLRSSFQFRLSYSVASELSPTSKYGTHYAQMITAQASCIEDLLGKRTPPEQVMQTWLELENSTLAVVKRMRFKRTMISVILILIIFSVPIAIGIFAATHGH